MYGKREVLDIRAPCSFLIFTYIDGTSNKIDLRLGRKFESHLLFLSGFINSTLEPMQTNQKYWQSSLIILVIS